VTKKLSLDWNQQVLNRLGLIEHKVDSLEQTTAFALRAEADKHRATARLIFKRSKRRAQVYLAANGFRGVQEIAVHLKMQRQNITPELKTLQEEGLLEIVGSSGGRDLWGKKPIDRTLRITQFLCEEFSLERDGRPLNKEKHRRTRR
jgi:biotin operon repressor